MDAKAYEARLWIKDYLLKSSRNREEELATLLSDHLLYLPIDVREHAEKVLSQRIFPAESQSITTQQ